MNVFAKPNQFVYAIVAVLFVILGVGVRPAHAGSYHLIEVPGSTTTSAWGINNLNQIVGYYCAEPGGVCFDQSFIHGFVLSNGKYTTIDYPGAEGTEVLGINDSGVMVGIDTTSDGLVHGWILQNGNFTQIDYPGATYTTPEAINNSGEIVGNESLAQPYTNHMFKYVNGTFTRMDIPGAQSEGANGVDANGDISGAYVANTNDYGFILRSDGKLLTINDPVNPNTTGLNGLNNTGQAAGTYLIADTFGNFEGFVWSHGKFFNGIMYPGSTSTWAIGINNNEIVVGFWDNSTTAEGFYYIP